MAVDMENEIALDQAFDYVEAVEKRDISKVDGVERDPVRFTVCCAHWRVTKAARHRVAPSGQT